MEYRTCVGGLANTDQGRGHYYIILNLTRSVLYSIATQVWAGAGLKIVVR